MARNVEDDETPAVGRIAFPIRLNKNLDGLVAGMDFYADRSILKINLMATTISASYDCISHADRPFSNREPMVPGQF